MEGIKTLILLQMISSTLSQQCSLGGLCVGTSLRTSDSGTKSECVDLCHNTDGCEFYTYDHKDSFCSAYSTCPILDEECTTCTTGENECPLVLCELNGGCTGILVDEFNTLGNEGRCGSTCLDDPSCNYYTYFSDSGNCLLYDTCELGENLCEGCVTSEKECFTQGEPVPGDLLVVVKSYTQPELSVIDLANPARVCVSESIGPLAQINNPQSLHGTFIGGELFVCGDTKDDCFRFDDKTLDWTRDENGGRSQDRFLAYGVDMASGVHWVTGGDDNGLTQTTEVFDGEVFQGGMGLPKATRDHCMVRLSDTEALLMGGYNMANDVYLLDLSVGGYSQQLSFPANLEEDLLMPQCGKATKSDGSEVVVLTGGFNSSDGNAVDETWVYDVNQGVWLPGQPLPETRAWGRAVQYEDTFVLVGGGDSNLESAIMREQILRYDADGSAWEVMEQELVNPDFVTVALMAPIDFVASCSSG